MCCILEGLCSDLGQLLRNFFVASRARLATTIQLLIDKLSGGGHNQQQQQQRQQERQADLLAAGPAYELKMMSKKGLLKFVKYTLIFSNAFGFILSIFLGLFGIAYPDKHFPLSYKGREMALCSLFCMLFTTIGYCGAQNHRRILLIIYGATNVIIVIIVVILWFLFRENSILGNKEISNMFITTLAITIAVMFLFAFILAFHIRTFKDDAQDSIVSQSHQLLQQTTAFLQQQQQHQLQQQAAGHPLGAPPHHLDAGEQTPVAFGMHPHQQQQQQHLMQHQQQQQQRSHHQAQLAGPAPHHAIQQQHHLQQQEMMMLGHHHAHSGASRMALMGGPQQQMAAPPPPPPPQAIQMTHIKSATGTGQRQKSLKGHAGGQLMLQPGASTSGHQMTLMRNQSSPLPDAGVSNYQTSGRQVKGQQQQQQLYSQSQKHARGHQPVEPPSPPSPPPPPPAAPPQAPSSGPNHVQQPPNNQQAQHHHQQQHHQSLMRPGGAHMPPACPVQYCTFDCDRTV